MSRVAVVRPADLKYYTKTRDFCDVHVTGGRAAFAHNVRRLLHCRTYGLSEGSASSAAAITCHVEPLHVLADRASGLKGFTFDNQ